MTSSSPVGFLSDLSATEAFENLKSNRHSRWPDRHEPTNRVEPMCAPHFAAPFPITPGASVFTIGSCFARNVEKGLIKLGFDVPARRAVGAGVDANVLNTFTANSMLNEVTWALDQNAPFDPAQHFYDMGGDKVADLHLGKRWTHPVARETALLRRAHVTQAYANLAQCRMLILTLGLAEAWYDAQLGLYLNSAPHKRLVSAHPERFRLHVLRQSDVVQSLTSLIALASAKNTVGGLRCVLTVSPVPLITTFRPDMDVIVANAYSKATLRSAAEEIAYASDNVSYFPSFESITLSERHVTWEDDQTHVRQPLVDMNVARMMARYVREDASAPSDPSILAQMALNKRAEDRPEEALALAERALAAQPDHERAVFAKIQALAAMDQHESALSFLNDRFADPLTGALDLEFAGADLQIFAVRLLLRLKQFDHALGLARQMLEHTPDHMPARIAMGDAYVGLGRLDAARASLAACLAMSKRKPMPYFKMAQLEQLCANPVAALRMVDIALTLKPDHVGALALKARLAP